MTCAILSHGFQEKYQKIFGNEKKDSSEPKNVSIEFTLKVYPLIFFFLYMFRLPNTCSNV